MKRTQDIWTVPALALGTSVGSLVTALIGGGPWAPLAWIGLGATLMLVMTPMIRRRSGE